MLKKEVIHKLALGKWYKVAREVYTSLLDSSILNSTATTVRFLPLLATDPSTTTFACGAENIQLMETQINEISE